VSAAPLPTPVVAPQVSVVIVSYRSREALARCLPSLERCAARVPLEVVVVDNASHDGTVAWLAATHPQVRAIESPGNVGFTRGVNLGVAHAVAPLLLILNPDCVVEPDALLKLIAVHARSPFLAAVAPRLVDSDGVTTRSCGRFPGVWSLLCDHLGLAAAWPDSRGFGGYKYGGTPPERLDRVDWASGAALLVSRDTWREIGPLDERIFMYMEEVDWCRRAAAEGRTVRYVPDAAIVHVGQQSSRQTPGETYVHNLRSRVYYFRKHHCPLAALAAKGILCASLALKWLVTRVRRDGRTAAPVYAIGFAAVWGAPLTTDVGTEGAGR